MGNSRSRRRDILEAIWAILTEEEILDSGIWSKILAKAKTEMYLTKVSYITHTSRHIAAALETGAKGY